MAIKKPTIYVLVLCIWLAFSNVALAEKIISFDSEINLNLDGSFVVTETITYDFEGVERRGIYRNIKNQHAQPATVWYKQRNIALELVSVKKNGNLEPYTLQDYDGLSVRIGDPEVYFTGKHEYEIAYKVDGAIAIYDDFQELYWNVTGEEWEVPIESSSLLVFEPASVMQDRQYCYEGVAGASTPCASSRVSAQGSEFISDRLSPGEQFTVAIKIRLPSAPTVLEVIDKTLFIVIGTLLWFVGLITCVYRWRIRYKTGDPVIAQYEPLPDLKPMFTGVLFDGRLDSRDISAGLVYLAQQGFISIKEVEQKIFKIFIVVDYKITLLKPLEEAETEFQRTILSLLFEVTPMKFEIISSFFRSAKYNFTPSGPESLVGNTISLNDIKKNNPKLRKNVEKIRVLKKAVKDDLVLMGFFEQIFDVYIEPKKIITFVASAAFIFIFFAQFNLSPLFFFIIILSLPILAFGFERRTRKGYDSLVYLKGFKDFLSVTDAERYKFHNAPSKNPEQFMEYLPYAIAFGVEKEWAKVFQDIQIPAPDWYQSSTSAGIINATALTSSLSSFTSSFSTSSGSSGSSGGGSSGGGSGGGGGGSW